MEQLYKDRLLKLADGMLDNANNKQGVKFDFHTWGWTENQPTEPLLNCGTTACAFGYAAISGLFKDEGFGYEVRDSGEIIFNWKGRDVANFQIGEALFGLSPRQFSYLFSSDWGREYSLGAEGEREAALRIKEFVQEEGVLPPAYTRRCL